MCGLVVVYALSFGLDCAWYYITFVKGGLQFKILDMFLGLLIEATAILGHVIVHNRAWGTPFKELCFQLGLAMAAVISYTLFGEGLYFLFASTQTQYPKFSFVLHFVWDPLKAVWSKVQDDGAIDIIMFFLNNMIWLTWLFFVAKAELICPFSNGGLMQRLILASFFTWVHSTDMDRFQMGKSNILSEASTFS